MSPYNKAIGKHLKALRKAKGYSSYLTFAQQNDLSPRQIIRMEKGENFSLDSLWPVLNALGVAPKEFFDGIHWTKDNLTS